MARESIRLVQVDFDNMENHNPEERKTIGVFVEGDNLSAHGKISEWFEKNGNFHLYLGWDGEVYPKFELETVTLH